ncbi:uncharacterized protein [Littorina saxatilis]|uniref:uncharacterized protein n=1 Tax=Littorina saxatilis TaxID=31220 RepID=UPI0038B53725
MFAAELGRKLIRHLHDFCYNDFTIVLCVIHYANFNKESFIDEVKKKSVRAKRYFTGRLELTAPGYDQVKAATLAISAVSNVPCLLPDSERSCEKEWLLLLDSMWRNVLSLVIEALDPTLHHDIRISCTDNNLDKMVIAVLEASRRWKLSTDMCVTTNNKSIHDIRSRLPVCVRRPRHKQDNWMMMSTNPQKVSNYISAIRHCSLSYINFT